MLSAMRGSLVSEYFAENLLEERFAGRLGERERETAWRALGRVRQACASLGPASSIRAILDVAASPLAELLGFRMTAASTIPRAARSWSSLWRSEEEHERPIAALLAGDGVRVGMVVTAWAADLDAVWRDAVLFGIQSNLRWCLLFNGRGIRLVDVVRSYGREHLEFDLDVLREDRPSFALFWSVLRAAAFAPSPGDKDRARSRGGRAGDNHPSSALLEEIIEVSAQHAVVVCRSLQDGVFEALSALIQGFIDSRAIPTRADVSPAVLEDVFAQSLTIVYRILFLLFAEARRLVPTWHATYRDAYSIEILRAAVERPHPARVAGLWETLRAISRLAHRGCHAGSLVVTPFNGRLFSPARTPLAESAGLADGVVQRVIVALSTEKAPAGKHRARIAYRDLGVEQLGAVYEGVLDYQPRVEPREPPPGRRSRPAPTVKLEGGSGRRKATGSFYTPRSLTGYLVRRTLHPLVEHATADDILRLRVLDPAMGSGAFLVAACRYLAAAYERALVTEGQRHAGDVDERDRASFRRTIAQRCLFGVDLNPMAVQLARLSLWLATLAADRPLTFLDHHLGVGDSLVGASPLDLLRYPARGVRHSPDGRESGLFDGDRWQNDVAAVLPDRLRVALEPADTVAAVRDKERAIEKLVGRNGRLARWKEAADLWCACWFWDDGGPPSRGVYYDVLDAVIGRTPSLPAAATTRVLERARRIAAARRFFHWQIEFPEVCSGDGPGNVAGFDAVIGNPPWDMLRADGEGEREDKIYDRALVDFAHGSLLYRAQGDGHPNRFQLFVERAFQLARPGARLGLVVPWGLLADRGCRDLRRMLFERADTDGIVGFDNAKAIFPIHRSVRFALVTATTGRPTRQTRCRFGERDVGSLDAMPDDRIESSPQTGSNEASAHYPIVLTPALLQRLSGSDWAVPDFRSAADVAIVSQIASAFPALSDPAGWGARFGRELNATDDRPHLVESGRGLPVLEGKHLDPFVAHVDRARFRIARDRAAALLGPSASFRRARLAYRDVASATNRVTLIAAVLPRDCVTTHTVFCLKTTMDEDAQWVLCGILNSYVANYLVRLRVTTHVSVSIVERLPVPVICAGEGIGAEIAALARELAANTHAADARLQARVARLYGLDAQQFRHVLSTFPLVEEAHRNAALDEFQRIGPTRGAAPAT